MTTRRPLVPWTGVMFFALMTTELLAQSGPGAAAKQNDTPNGKPFQQIQTQLDAMDVRIQALQVQINSVESAVQKQLAGIQASYASLSGWIDSVDAALASIGNRLDANDASIAAHQGAIGLLAGSLAAVQMELTTLQSQVSAYSSDTSANTAAILALQEQAVDLQELIDEHAGQIAILQGQISSVHEFLTTMANATCAVGEAISDVGAGGSITCMTTAGLDVQMTEMSWNFGPNTLRTFELFCPAGYKAVSGGYDGAWGITVVSAFPRPSSYVVRVQSPFVSSTIKVFATCAR